MIGIYLNQKYIQIEIQFNWCGIYTFNACSVSCESVGSHTSLLPQTQLSLQYLNMVLGRPISKDSASHLFQVRYRESMGRTAHFPNEP